MLRRIQHTLTQYIALMTQSLEKLNHRIDRLGMDSVAGGQPPPLSGVDDDGVSLIEG